MSIEDCRWFLEDRLTTIVGQLAPSDELGFVFQVSIAFYRRRGNPDRDTSTITAAGTLPGTPSGVGGRSGGAAQLTDDGPPPVPSRFADRRK